MWQNFENYLNLFSWIKLAWLISTVGIFLSGSTALFFPHLLPFLNDLVKYGKSQSSERSVVHRWIEVPKKWFTHFYFFASIVTFFAFIQLLLFYYFEIPPISFVRQWLTYISDPKPDRTIDEFSAVLTTCLLWLHVLRRLFESLFISVYSNSRMNLLHYMLGYVHYFLLPATILAESPGFASSGKYAFNWNALTFMQIFGIVLFLWSSFEQHRCFSILSEMRRNYLGNITNYAHGIPITGYFDYVSCPHFLFEIFIYVSLYFTLNSRHDSWPYVLAFVLTNQTLAALITHQWYNEKYPRLYPKHRRALIPLIL